jgi:hypothetical protein
MKKIAVVIALFFSLPKHSLAWGKDGHQMTANIAWYFLDENSRQIISKYLHGIKFAQAGTWMDDMRSDSYYNYMRTWHYIDFEKDSVYRPTAEKNALTVLNAAVIGLQHPENLKDRDIKTDILLIFHLVGDFHQPLHTGYASDKGGNSVDVSFLKGSTNLHHVWDSDIIDEKEIKMEDCIKLYSTLSADEVAKIKQIKIMQWMRESRALLNDVYDFKDGKIDQAYVDKNAEIIKMQLLKGGLRLASILEMAAKALSASSNPSQDSKPKTDSTNIHSYVAKHEEEITV